MHRYDLDQTDSTNTRAAAYVAEHPGEVVLVTATTQTAGRGTWGRDWQSPAGGAWFSLAIPMDTVNEMISLSAAAAVREALGAFVEAKRLRVEPPNDVMLDGKKVAGLLCEQTIRPGKAGTTTIIGVGINVNLDPTSLGDDLRRPATSLSVALNHEDVSVDEVIDRCVAMLCAKLAPGVSA